MSPTRILSELSLGLRHKSAGDPCSTIRAGRLLAGVWFVLLWGDPPRLACSEPSFHTQIMLWICAHYAHSPTLSLPSTESLLAMLATTGFIVYAFPNDLYHTVHSIGVGVVLGTLYSFTLIFHFMSSVFSIECRRLHLRVGIAGSNASDGAMRVRSRNRNPRGQACTRSIFGSYIGLSEASAGYRRPAISISNLASLTNSEVTPSRFSTRPRPTAPRSVCP
jgi:hypothetical protein